MVFLSLIFFSLTIFFVNNSTITSGGKKEKPLPKKERLKLKREPACSSHTNRVITPTQHVIPAVSGVDKSAHKHSELFYNSADILPPNILNGVHDGDIAPPKI